VRWVAELALLFLFFLLFFNFYAGLLPGRPVPRSTGYVLSFELRLSALVLALVSGFARARSLTGCRAARWLEFACWSLYFAGLIALSFSPERADPWSWHLPAWTGTAIYLILYGPARVLSVPVSAPVKQLTVEEMYGELLDAYLQAWGGPPERVKAKIEAEIRKLVERGLSREEAVKRLYRRMLLGYFEARIAGKL
jgi:hypothetical protein